MVFFAVPTWGHATPLALTPISPETVLIAVTPEAPPSSAALAMVTISVMFGVSFTKNGILMLSLTHPQIPLTSSSFYQNVLDMNQEKRVELVSYLSTCKPHSRLAHSMRTAQVQLQHVSATFFSFPRQFSPILLAISAHNRSDDDLNMFHNLHLIIPSSKTLSRIDYLCWKVLLQLLDPLQPKLAVLFRNHFDVQK